MIGERFVALPGGVTVTRRTTTQVWSYPNIHGDIAAIADQTGTKTGTTATYDPYGQPSTAPPDNITGPADWAWQGSAHKTTDAPSGIIQMGARPYQPALGRFLTVDPILGGSANDYDYVGGNPISAFDIDGTAVGNPCGSVWKVVGCVAVVAAAVALGKRLARGATDACPAVGPEIPQAATDMLRYLVEHNMQPPRGFSGGGPFNDWKNLLPPGGDYRKFDVYSTGDAGRLADRIVYCSITGRAWYWDHEDTIVPMPSPNVGT